MDTTAVANDVLARKPIAALRGVGDRVAKELERLSIFSQQDLLFHLPLRYEDRTQLVPIAELRPGQHVLVEGEIAQVEKPRGPRRSFLCRLQDGFSGITLRFFHLYPNQVAMLEPGTRLRCFGEVRAGYNSLELVHPEFMRVDADAEPPLPATLTAVLT